MLEYHELSSLSRATRPSGEEPGLGFLRVFMFASRDSAEVMEIDNRIESCYIDKMKSTSEAMSNKTRRSEPRSFQESLADYDNHSSWHVFHESHTFRSLAAQVCNQRAEITFLIIQLPRPQPWTFVFMLHPGQELSDSPSLRSNQDHISTCKFCRIDLPYAVFVILAA